MGHRQEIQVNIENHKFKIQIGGGMITFFDASNPKKLVRFGTTPYSVSPDGKTLKIEDSSYDIKPEKVGLDNQGIGRLEKILLQEAGMEILGKRPRIERVVRSIRDTRRNIIIERASLLKPAKGRAETSQDLSLGVGPREGKPGGLWKRLWRRLR